MTGPSPVQAPLHSLTLLAGLHKKSLEQEAALSKTGKVFSTTLINDLASNSEARLDHADAEDKKPTPGTAAFDNLMLDKFIALDEDKCQFMYSLLLSTGGTNVIEAGTSFGVSTIYLALAIGENKRRLGKDGVVIGTEKEAAKADVARGFWAQCGEAVVKGIELRVGDLLETLGSGLPAQVDMLLLDIWSALALPTLKLVQLHLRPGAVVLTDNTISGAEGYKELLAYMRAPGSGFRNMTLPFTNGFEMSVYSPGSGIE